MGVKFWYCILVGMLVVILVKVNNGLVICLFILMVIIKFIRFKNNSKFNFCID